MSQGGERESRASAEALLKKAQKLEHQLRATLQSKGFSDGVAYSLLTTLRSTYQEILLTDHAFAVEHEVEQALWRGIYRRIEDFRSRIRKYSQAAAGVQGPPTSGAPPKPGGTKPGAGKEPLQKALAGFRGFLGDATGFYHELVFKLRGLYGLPQDFSPGVPQEVAARVPAEKLRLCQASCHRCLIYLGDLARYKELHSDAKVKDWSIVANYYLQAAALWPASGNPHNQLAVLATYVDDELLAVYRYYRSLAVKVPFLTARDNLLMLFEKNRAKYSHLAAPAKAAPKTTPPDDDNLSKTRLSFRIRFVRLNGIIFTKTSVETFSDVYTATMSELDTLLEADDVAFESGSGSERRSGVGSEVGMAAGALQVIVVALFTVHNLSWVPEGHKPSYSEIIQSSTLAQHAYTALFELAGRLVHRCGLGAKPAANPLLPSILVLLDWFMCNPKAAIGDGNVSDRQARARTFFWREVSGLLNDVIDDVTSREPDRRALWEDYELRGFEPLAEVQKGLDCTKLAPSFDVGDSHQAAERGRRVLNAGKVLAGRLTDARVEGLRFSEELGLFQYSREVSQRKPEDFKVLERGEVPNVTTLLPGDLLGQELGGELGLGQGLVKSGTESAGHNQNETDLFAAPGLALKKAVIPQGLKSNAAVVPGFGQGLEEEAAGLGEGLEDAQGEEEDFEASSKEELEAAKKQLFERAQQAGKLKGFARDQLAAEAERVFRAQLAAKKGVKHRGEQGVKEGVKPVEERLDEDEEEIVFQPTRRSLSQASPLTGSPMQSQSPRPDTEKLGPVRPPDTSVSLPPSLHSEPKLGFLTGSDPVAGSSAFSFNEWMPGGAKRGDAAKSTGFDPYPHNLPHEKARVDIEAVTNDVLRESAPVTKPLHPEIQARGYEQLQQLYELQRQLQGGSFSQAMYPPASTDILQGGAFLQGNEPLVSEATALAQQQYYKMLVAQQQRLANHGAPAQHQNVPPQFQQWGSSPYPWTTPLQSSSLFGGLGFGAPQPSGLFGSSGYGLNPTENPNPYQAMNVSAQGPTRQEAHVTIPLPKPLSPEAQNISTPSLFAAPPVLNRLETPPSQGLDSLFGTRTSPTPGGGSLPSQGGPTRPFPPGFGPPQQVATSIRPPPGFGQRPTSPYTANGTSAPLQNYSGSPPVDDYKWLDGYTHTKPQTPEDARLDSTEHFRGEYAIGEPSIWGRSSSPASEWGGKQLPENKKVSGQTYGGSAYDTKNPFVS